jgi:hypothetical protein
MKKKETYSTNTTCNRRVVVEPRTVMVEHVLVWVKELLLL